MDKSFIHDDIKSATEKVDVESNYGSDIDFEDETALTALLVKTEPEHLSQLRGSPPASCIDVANDNHGLQGLLADNATVPWPLEDESGVSFEILVSNEPAHEASADLKYGMPRRVTFSRTFCHMLFHYLVLTN